MKLRNGKIYYYKPNIKRITKKKPIHTNFCCICCEDYKKGDYITSCKDSNFKKHTFHVSCISEVMHICIDLNQSRICPYCRINLDYNKTQIITVK